MRSATQVPHSRTAARQRRHPPPPSGAAALFPSSPSPTAPDRSGSAQDRSCGSPAKSEHPRRRARRFRAPVRRSTPVRATTAPKSPQGPARPETPSRQARGPRRTPPAFGAGTRRPAAPRPSRTGSRPLAPRQVSGPSVSPAGSPCRPLPAARSRTRARLAGSGSRRSRPAGRRTGLRGRRRRRPPVPGPPQPPPRRPPRDPRSATGRRSGAPAHRHPGSPGRAFWPPYRCRSWRSRRPPWLSSWRAASPGGPPGRTWNCPTGPRRL
jgi:hypothetical protein